MLSDEEKEALRNFKSEYETCDHYSSDLIIELDDAEIILNLIEKQSKEIEEYKKQLDLDYVDKNFVPIERYNQLEKEIEELKDKNKKLNKLKGFEMLDIFNMGKQSSRQRIEFDYVDKEKIKAKIEELEKEQEDNRKNLYNAINNLCFKEIDKISDKIYVNMSVKDILQSLLEKE